MGVSLHPERQSGTCEIDRQRDSWRGRCPHAVEEPQLHAPHDVLDGLQFKTSSFCSDCGCVEVGISHDRVVVRDNKIIDSPLLTFTRNEWVDFIAGVKNGEFDVT